MDTHHKDIWSAIMTFIPTRAALRLQCTCTFFRALPIFWRPRVSHVLSADEPLDEMLLKRLNHELDKRAKSPWLALFQIDDKSLIPHYKGIVESGLVGDMTKEKDRKNLWFAAVFSDNLSLFKLIQQNYVSISSRQAADGKVYDFSFSDAMSRLIRSGSFKCFKAAFFTADHKTINEWLGTRQGLHDFGSIYSADPCVMLELIKQWDKTKDSVAYLWICIAGNESEDDNPSKIELICYLIELGKQQEYNVTDDVICVCALRDETWQVLLKNYPDVVERIRNVHDDTRCNYDWAWKYDDIYSRFIEYVPDLVYSRKEEEEEED